MLQRLGWRALFVVGVLPAIAAFFIRRTVEEPAIWREREPQRRSPWPIIFGPFLPRTILASLLASSVLVAFWGVITWLPSFLATPVAKGGAGLTLTKSAAWIMVLQVGAFFGYVTFGWIADRIGRRPAFFIFMIAASAVVPLFAFYARTPATFLSIGFLVGYFAHGYFSLFGAMLAELYPTEVRGTAQGFCYNVGRLASAIAPIAIGASAAKHGLGTAIAADSLFFLVGAVLIWLLPETRGQELA